MVIDLHITDQEFELFQRLIYSKSGINLSTEKKSLLQTRLNKRLQHRNCETFSQYYRYIKNDPTGEELIAMLNAISTNLTKFFREEGHFKFLHNTVLPELIEKKRKKGNGQCNNYSVKPSLRNMVTFRRLNLTEEDYPFKGKFDFIFCRNVMIYFDKKTQEKIVNRFFNYLEDRGFLFIGHSESLNGVKSSFKYFMPAVYRKEGV